MSNNLYELTHDLMTIDNEIEEAGEITDDLEKRLDDVSLAIKDKAHGIVKWVKNLESNEVAIQSEIDRFQLEIDRLKVRKGIRENKGRRLKEYLEKAMKTAGIKKFDFDNFTVSVIDNPVSCEMETPAIIPAKYITIIESIQIRKADVLKDLKAGDKIPGAKLRDRTTRLNIK